MTTSGPSLEIQKSIPNLMRSSPSAGLTTKVAWETISHSLYLGLVGGKRCLLGYTSFDCPSFQRMPRSTHCEQVTVLSAHMITRSHMKYYRSVFINSLLIFWAFQLSLDPTKLQDDMGFTTTAIPNVPCTIEFRTRVPEAELRHMMQNYPEAGWEALTARYQAVGDELSNRSSLEDLYHVSNLVPSLTLV